MCTKSEPRVLIAEDEADVRGWVGIAMRGQPFIVTMAKDGADALARYRLARDSGWPFDLLVLDMMMPPLSGLAVAEAIRAEGDGDTPIVLWTAADSPVVEMRVTAANIAAVWPKVEPPDVLVRRIHEALGLQAQEVAGAL